MTTGGPRGADASAANGGYALNRSGLAAAVRELGLVVLGIGEHRATPEVLIVYLHGPAGQWVDAHALRTVASIRVSLLSPSP